MKEQLLDLLQDMMMGSHGSKMKPKAISIDVVKMKPGEDLDDVLTKARDDMPVEEMTERPEEEMEEDCDDDYKKDKGRSLQDYFKKMRG